MHIKELRPDPENRRQHNPRNLGMVVDALHQVGAARSIVVDEGNVVLAGNGVIEAAAEAGITEVRIIEASGSELIAVRRSGLSAAQKRALAIFDNRAGELATWDADQLQADLAAGLELQPWFSDEELRRLGVLPETEGSAAITLRERFGVPPFSVLDARQGYWQQRKRAWLALGIQSEIGRARDAAPGGAPLPGVRGPRKDYKPGQARHA